MAAAVEEQDNSWSGWFKFKVVTIAAIGATVATVATAATAFTALFSGPEEANDFSGTSNDTYTVNGLFYFAATLLPILLDKVSCTKKVAASLAMVTLALAGGAYTLGPKNIIDESDANALGNGLTALSLIAFSSATWESKEGFNCRHNRGHLSTITIGVLTIASSSLSLVFNSQNWSAASNIIINIDGVS